MSKITNTQYNFNIKGKEIDIIREGADKWKVFIDGEHKLGILGEEDGIGKSKELNLEEAKRMIEEYLN